MLFDEFKANVRHFVSQMSHETKLLMCYLMGQMLHKTIFLVDNSSHIFLLHRWQFYGMLVNVSTDCVVYLYDIVSGVYYKEQQHIQHQSSLHSADMLHKLSCSF